MDNQPVNFFSKNNPFVFHKTVSMFQWEADSRLTIQLGEEKIWLKEGWKKGAPAMREMR